MRKILASRLRVLAVALCAVSAVSCLEPAEPTPVSTLVSIDPLDSYARGHQTDAASSFHMEFRVQNTGSRNVFIDTGYTRTEKLVNQKWELAAERVPSGNPFSSSRMLRPNQSTVLSVDVNDFPGTSPASTLLRNLRGLYRTRFRMSFTPNGTELLAPEDSYSAPFSVTID